MEANTTPPVINAMWWIWHDTLHKAWDDIKQARWTLLREYMDKETYLKFKDEIHNYYMRPYWRKYYEDNKERLNENKKKYNEIHKEQMVARGKKYREANKEKIKEKNKQYYNKKKDDILAKEKEKVVCDCGDIICKHSLTRHEKTKKHQQWLASH